MSNIETLKELVKNKSKNIITDDKAQYLLDVIKKKFPTENLDKAIAKLKNYSELPKWLNNDLTINETFFFRHVEHFKKLETYLKEVSTKKKSIDILCCGVASGEEAYSIGMVVKKYFNLNFSILGVDLSQQAIDVAAEGKYTATSKGRISGQYADLWNENISVKKVFSKQEFIIKDDLMKCIKFKMGNIFNFPLKNYDIIFIRNILIYFNDEDKIIILEKIVNKVNPEGLVFIGAGEILPKKISSSNVLISTSIMKKVA